MNKLVGENLSIMTAKAQTTRHRIMGILNADDFQIVYSDTPGLLEPKYELHKAMMSYVRVSLEDADVILLVVDWNETFDEMLFAPIIKSQKSILLIINKADLSKNEEETRVKIEYWKKIFPAAQCLTVSAKTGKGVEALLPLIKVMMPEHPSYFPKDEFTTRSERFFASEMIREKIFLNYEQEIPYSTEVAIESFKEEETIIRIRAIIFVERDSQKRILIGAGGSRIKELGKAARAKIEPLVGGPVYLDLWVKVLHNWRKNAASLSRLGYRLPEHDVT